MGQRGRRRWARGAGLCSLLVWATVAGALPGAASWRAGSPATSPPANTWPKMAHDDANSGVSPDPLLSVANAAQLGVRWMSPTGTTDYSSPVVQWNATVGETLVYQGNEDGYLTAFDEADGQTVWSDDLGSAIRDTPLVVGGSVWVADTYSPELFKLNAATGARQCATRLVSTDNGSPTAGPGPGGTPSVFIGVNDLGTANGPLYAVDQSDCKVEWTYTTYDGNDAAGSWDPLAYATSAHGTPMVVFGTADPDSSVYAVNARTGTTVWSFKTFKNPTFADDDVGAGVSITAPGVNGFAGGVVYVPGKDGYMYALNLTTGALIWDFNFGKAFDIGPEYSRATPAVVGDTVIFGGTMGLAALDATTGKVVWRSRAAGGGEVLSASAVVGPAGSQVVAVTSVSGELSVFSVATGALVYSYQMGQFSVASVADVDGNLLANSSDGFLYDFAVGGANTGAPATAVTSPADGAVVANPDGDLTVSGTASGGPIAGVDVAVQEGGPLGPWWNASSGTFTPGYWNNQATLSSPGADTTAWSLTLPVPTGGGTYRVAASAVGADGLADTSADTGPPAPSQDAFTVRHLKSSPHLRTLGTDYVAPGGVLRAAGSGFGDAETVDLSLGGVQVATVTTSASGSFPATRVRVPADAGFGVRPLVATGTTSGDTTSTAVDVSNEWTAAGYDGTNSAFEPNDLTLRNHVSPGSFVYLTQAWSYPSGAAVSSTPVVDEGTLYTANAAGTVTALGVHQSNPLWTAAAGGAVVSSPVVTDGLVVVATTGGSVVALSAATGAEVWSTPVSSAVDASPAVDGDLLVVGTSDGTLYAMAATSGHVVWQEALPGPVVGAPAVAGTTVVVGAGDDVVALDGTDGTVVWTVATKGAVTADPTVVGGQVYVGSRSGKVYRIDEASGAVGWTFGAGSPVTAGGSLMPFKSTEYVVGAKDGAVYFLGASDGHVAKHFDAKSPVVGVSSASGFAVVTTAGGTALGYKYTGGASWEYLAPAPLASAAAIVNGVVYLGGEDQTVRAFTIPGHPIP